MTNLEGRVLRRRRAVAPPPGVRDELEVWADLARRLGSAGSFHTDPAEVFAELAAASAGGRADYAGLDHARLDTEDEATGHHWPVRRAGESTPRLFTETFAHPDGRARFHAVSPGEPAERSQTAPLHLVTGRVLAQYQSGAQTRRVEALRRAAPGSFVELHPRLARTLGVGEGQEVEVTSPRGSVRAPARISHGIRPDTVFMPFHWPGSANQLTSDVTDPVCGMPAFKLSAVSVVPVVGPAEEAAP